MSLNGGCALFNGGGPFVLWLWRRSAVLCHCTGGSVQQQEVDTML